MKKKEEPPPPKEEPKPPPKDVVMAPPPPKGFQVLTAPVKVPDVLPDIDLTKKVTDEADFSGKGVAGGVAKGVVGGTGRSTPTSRTSSSRWRSRSRRFPAPATCAYPDMLRSANVEGEVLAQFVVDTTGRYETGTFKVLKSSRTSSSRRRSRTRCPNMRFYPAEVGGAR